MESYEYNPNMNNRLLKIRKALKLTQSEIGDAIGISGSHFGNLERGGDDATIGANIVIAMCNGFSVNYNYLVHGEEPMFNERTARLKKLERVFSELSEPYQDFLLEYISNLKRFEHERRAEQDE